MIDMPHATPPRAEALASEPGITPDTVYKVGGASIDIVNRTPRMITMGSAEFMTNLPAGIDPFERKEGGRSTLRPGLNHYLRPSDMDSLPVGEYTVNGKMLDESSWGEAEVDVERHINVIESTYGKAIDVNSLRAGWETEPSPGASGLLSQLGYVLDEDGLILAVPTPNTVKKAAHDNFGVEVELIEEAEIPAGRYVGIFEEGKYPVATKTEGYYKHDIEDDHLTAVALGGAPLMDALQAAAKSSEKDGDSLNETAGGIDAYTVALRAIVAEFKSVIGQEFGETEGRRTLTKKGERLGILPETTSEIIATSQQTARRLGMNVKELD